MTADPGRRGSAWGRRRRGGVRQVLPVRLLHVGPAERIQMLTVGGRVLQVATRDGDPDRPPLLLCNGIGARLELFQPFVNARDPRRAIIRFDMPGIGESPAPVVPYHLAALAPLLTGLLDRLGVARADVLGISWGGGLAQQFALSRPDRVRRLVLVATGPGALMVPGHPKVLLRMVMPRRHRDPGHAAARFGKPPGSGLGDLPADHVGVTGRCIRVNLAFRLRPAASARSTGPWRARG